MTRDEREQREQAEATAQWKLWENQRLHPNDIDEKDWREMVREELERLKDYGEL
mgnify:CR=1 FL=1